MRWFIIITALSALVVGSLITTGDDVPSNLNTTEGGADAITSQRASEIIGLAVKNAEGKELATVKDIVLDPLRGNILYYAVSYGGWLGVGDKIFVIPHHSFDWRHESPNINYLVLNLPEQKLKSGPGFDQDAWPDFANDAQWREKIDLYYSERADRIELFAPTRR